MTEMEYDKNLILHGCIALGLGFSLIFIALFLTFSYMIDGSIAKIFTPLVSLVLLHLPVGIQSNTISLLTYFSTIIFLMICLISPVSLVTVFYRCFIKKEIAY